MIERGVVGESGAIANIDAAVADYSASSRFFGSARFPHFTLMALRSAPLRTIDPVVACLRFARVRRIALGPPFPPTMCAAR